MIEGDRGRQGDTGDRQRETGGQGEAEILYSGRQRDTGGDRERLGGDRGIQVETEGDKGRQSDTRGDRETGGNRGRQEETEGDRRKQRDTGRDRGRQYTNDMLSQIFFRESHEGTIFYYMAYFGLTSYRQLYIVI